MKRCHVDERNSRLALLLLLMIGVFVSSAYAPDPGDKDKKQQQPKAVGIYLVGHLPLSETEVSNISATSDSSRHLLQLTDAAQRILTVVDVSAPAQPRFLEQTRLPADFENASLQTRIGDTALFATTDSSSVDRNH